MFNTFVTNGYLTPEAVDMISPYLDAATVDFEGAGDPIFYKEVMRVPSVEPIYQCLEAMKSNNIHIEVTNLIAPRIGDSDEKLLKLACWIIGNLGEDTPMHLLRFFPGGDMFEVEEIPTASIEKARKICCEAGLSVTKWELRDDMTCPKCGTKIAIKGKYHGSTSARLKILK